MITAEDVRHARSRIAGHVVATPVVPSARLSRAVGQPVALKLESVQPTGSFKLRGAASRLLALGSAQRNAGVVTASTGNHGRAVAYVARELGIAATVCVSEHVPPGKIAALRSLGCDLHVAGRSQTEALATARARAEQHGLTLVHPFEDPDVVAGQGTIGSELLDQLPDVRTVLVPLSGGGLIGGIAVAVRDARPDARVVGVCMQRGAAMAASLAAGGPVEVDEASSLADSLQGGVGRGTFDLVRRFVDDIVQVDEASIWEGMRYAFDEHRLVLEGAGAVGIAALLAGSLTLRGTTAIVCSGANAEDRHVRALADRADTPPP